MKGIGMAVEQDVIDVRVSQRILWIGSDAYPLQNISRVGTDTWQPQGGVFVMNFMKPVMPWLVMGSIAAILVGLTGLPRGLLALVVLSVLALAVAKIIQLVALMNSTFHELSIDTSGASRTALISKDQAVVQELVARITDAINNPMAEFQMQVVNHHVGDVINQHGNHNTGKVVR
jgi:hypothetical protein